MGSYLIFKVIIKNKNNTNWSSQTQLYRIWRQVKVDRLSDRVALTPVNCAIFSSFTLGLIKGVPQKRVTIKIFDLLPKFGVKLFKCKQFLGLFFLRAG